MDETLEFIDDLFAAMDFKSNADDEKELEPLMVGQLDSLLPFALPFISMKFFE